MAEAPSILFVNRVFPPDRGASGRCLADLAGRLARAGWRVTVVADGAGPVDAPLGVAVVRAGGPGRERPGAPGYVAALGRLLLCGASLPRHDVVVTMTDPPLLALAGPPLALRHGAAVHWCHDLYPALLPVLGVPLRGAVMGALHTVTTAALKRHAAVIAIGRCMVARLRAAGLGDPVSIPNWADPSIRPLPRSASALRRELGLGERFTVAYAGNFGLAHPLGALLAAAAALPDVSFVLVGEGRGYAAAASAAHALENVRILPFQPTERLSDTLAAADLHVAAMDRRASGLLVPCKVYGALAAGRPCLFLGPEGSEAARLLDEVGCGIVLAPDDGAGFARAIRAYAADPARCAIEGRRALAASARWDADVAAARFMELAESVRRASHAAAPAWTVDHG